MKHNNQFLAILLAFAMLPVMAYAGPRSGTFIEKEKSVSGSWTIHEKEGSLFLVLSEDFKAKNGPDLKLFLSPLAFETTTGKNALSGAILIDELEKTKGAQNYKLPAGLKLDQYKSLLLHCERYAVLWGGSDL